MRYVTKICRMCEKSFSREPSALYCFPCTKDRRGKRVAGADRKRVGYIRPLRIDGKFVCLDCHTPVAHERGFPRLRCEPCRGRHRYMLDTLSGRSNAQSKVHIAIRRGDMKKAAEFICVDCGRPAEVYDHRDYSQPLAVEPVCRCCNIMRGSAKPAWHIPASHRITT